MGLVQHEKRAEFILQPGNFTERPGVAVHAKNGLGHNEDARLRMFFPRPAQVMFERMDVIVRKGTADRSAEAGAINQARMAEAVEDYDIIAPGERLQGSGSCGIAAAENKRGLRALECRELLLQIRMRALRAGDQAGCAGTGTEVTSRPGCGFDDSGMRGEAEVVVRCEVVQRFTAEAQGGAGGRIGNAQAAEKGAAFQVAEGLL